MGSGRRWRGWGSGRRWRRVWARVVALYVSEGGGAVWGEGGGAVWARAVAPCGARPTCVCARVRHVYVCVRARHVCVRVRHVYVCVRARAARVRVCARHLCVRGMSVAGGVLARSAPARAKCAPVAHAARHGRCEALLRRDRVGGAVHVDRTATNLDRRRRRARDRPVRAESDACGAARL
eukprot:6439483-Prymnesium_polylepis.1